MKIHFPSGTVISLLFFVMVGCDEEAPSTHTYDRDYKKDMRTFIEGISTYARSIQPKFILVPQNGEALVTIDGKLGSYPDLVYLRAVNGIAREDLFFGYNNFDQATPQWINADIISYLQVPMIYHKVVLVTDYCSSKNNIDLSYTQSSVYGFISYAAPTRELDKIAIYPSIPYHANQNNMDSLPMAKNFVYVLAPENNWPQKGNFIEEIINTNYDLLITDLFFNGVPFTRPEVQALKIKANGGKRIVLAYISIGEAENYRYYWQSAWSTSPPEWLKEENPDWPGNYRVAYWLSPWQEIIFGNNTSYIHRIIDAGFDGVYLDGVDVFEYFEEQFEK
jgi:cysteinyl-tRNA synthetase